VTPTIDTGPGSRMPPLEMAMPYHDEKATASHHYLCEDCHLRFQAAAVLCWLGALGSAAARNQLGVKYLVAAAGLHQGKAKMANLKTSGNSIAEYRLSGAVAMCHCYYNMNTQLLVDACSRPQKGHARGRWRDLVQQAMAS
jgi:hypothetical protein